MPAYYDHDGMAVASLFMKEKKATLRMLGVSRLFFFTITLSQMARTVSLS